MSASAQPPSPFRQAAMRLALGFFLIVAASAVLLYTDRGRRKSALAAKAAADAAAAAAGDEVVHKHRVAILQHSSQAVLDEGVAGMIAALADAGFRDGDTIELRRFNAEGDLPTANSIAAQLVDGSYDLVLTASTLSMQCVANANRDGKARHVFALVSSPSTSGVGVSATDPLGHPPYMAGFATMQPIEEALRLAKRMNPKLARVGVVWNSAEANSEAQMKLAYPVAKELGIAFEEATVSNSNEVVQGAAAVASRGVEAFFAIGDVTVMTSIEAILEAAVRAKIPVFSVIPPQVGKGALFDLGANYFEVGLRAGQIGADILNGGDPANVEIVNYCPIRLNLNQKALAGLNPGWSIPEDLLAKADLLIDANGVPHEKNPPPTPVASAGASGAGAAAAPKPAPGRTYKIGLAYFGPDPGADACMAGLFERLASFGFVEGKNLEVRRVHANGEIAGIPAMLQQLDASDADVIVPLSTPCITASLTQIRSKPIVFTFCYDPIAAGVGKSFTDHLPNVTGIGSFPPIEETVATILRLVPGAKKVGTLHNAAEANSVKAVGIAREAFRAKGIELEEVTIGTSADVLQAAQALVGRGVQAIWVTGDNTALQAVDSIVSAARDAKLPLILNDADFVDRGALCAIGIGFKESGAAAALPLARVLTGESPAGIPIENVSVRNNVFNDAVARTLGIAIPDDLRGAGPAPAAPGAATAFASTNARPKHPVDSRPLGRKARIHLLQFVETIDVEDAERGFREGLKATGLVEGRDYEIAKSNAQGDMATLNSLVDAAVSDGARMLVTFSTPTLQTAMGKVKDLPILFTYVANAIAAGAGKSDTDHLPNVTGFYSIQPSGEMLDTLLECSPKARRVGTLFQPSEINSVAMLEHLTAAAKQRGMEVVSVPVNVSGDVPDAALALVSKKIDAITQIAGNLTSVAFGSIARAGQQAGLPVFAVMSQAARDGAAVVLARDHYDDAYEVAGYASRVLRGEDPSKIPFGTSRTIGLLVNTKSAAAANFKIPPAVLARAVQDLGDPGSVKKPAGAVSAAPAGPSASPVATASVGAGAPIQKEAPKIPVDARPLSKKWKVHMLQYVETIDVEESEAGIRAGLKESGLVEGRDYVLTKSNAQGDMATLNSMVDAAISDGADLLITFSTPTLQVTMGKVKDIPVVFTYLADPIAAGAGRSDTDHLPNVTGFYSLAAFDQLLTLVQQCLPKVKRIGTLFCPAEVNSVVHRDRITEAARKRGIEVVASPVNTSGDVPDAALALVGRDLDAVVQISGNLTAVAFSSIARAGQQARLPIFGFMTQQCRDGAAIVVARDYWDDGHGAAGSAVRIMRGENPARIPFQITDKFRLLVNTEAAKAGGFKIPEDIVRRAEADLGKEARK